MCPLTSPHISHLLIAICFIFVHQTAAGNDFLSSWGSNELTVDEYYKHALCVESKAYFVNSSDERSQSCPKRTCQFDVWKRKHYDGEKFLLNRKYALKKIPYQEAKNYLYLPKSSPDAHQTNEVHARNVVVSILNADFGNQLYQASFGQMVAEQHDAVFYTHFLDSHYRTDKESAANTAPQKPEQLGHAAIRKYIDPLFLWELLPDSHPDKLTCSRRNVTFTKRVYDIKHPHRTNEKFNTNLMDFVHSSDGAGSQCLVILGFFKNLYPCEQAVKQMWASLERETEQAKSISTSRTDRQTQLAQKARSVYNSYKRIATHQPELVSKHRGASSGIIYKRKVPKPAAPPPRKKINALHTPPKVGHIIGVTSYERDNGPDLLMKRLRHKKLQKEEGKHSGLFLDGVDIS